MIERIQLFPKSVIAGFGLAIVLSGSAAASDADGQESSGTPKTVIWNGPDTPLGDDLVEFLTESASYNIDDVLKRFDVENGFVFLPEETPTIFDTEEELRRLFGAAGDGGGRYVKNDIVDIKLLGDDFVSLISENRGVYYTENLNRPYFYIELRTAYVLRRTGNSFKIVYQIEAPLAPITYLWKLHADTAESFLKENGQELWSEPPG